MQHSVRLSLCCLINSLAGHSTHLHILAMLNTRETSPVPSSTESRYHWQRQDSLSWHCLPSPPLSYSSSSSSCNHHQQERYRPNLWPTSFTPRLIPANRPPTPRTRTGHTDRDGYYHNLLHHSSYHHRRASMPYPAHRPYSAPAPAPPPLWTENVFYQRGSLVSYAGSVWRCDSPHTSGSLAREVSGARTKVSHQHIADSIFSQQRACTSGRRLEAASVRLRTALHLHWHMHRLSHHHTCLSGRRRRQPARRGHARTRCARTAMRRAKPHICVRNLQGRGYGASVASGYLHTPRTSRPSECAKRHGENGQKTTAGRSGCTLRVHGRQRIIAHTMRGECARSCGGTLSRGPTPSHLTHCPWAERRVESSSTLQERGWAAESRSESGY